MSGTDLIRAQKLIEQKLVGFKTKGYDLEAIRQGAYDALYALREAQAKEVSTALAAAITSSAGAGLASTADQLGYLEEQLGPVAQSNDPVTLSPDEQVTELIETFTAEQLGEIVNKVANFLAPSKKDREKKPKDEPVAPQTPTANDGAAQ